eukprot:COSAG05_NODE_355_length_10856_cov_7.197174_15_plen_287_part_00
MGVPATEAATAKAVLANASVVVVRNLRGATPWCAPRPREGTPCPLPLPVCVPVLTIGTLFSRPVDCGQWFECAKMQEVARLADEGVESVLHNSSSWGVTTALLCNAKVVGVCNLWVPVTDELSPSFALHQGNYASESWSCRLYLQAVVGVHTLLHKLQPPAVVRAIRHLPCSVDPCLMPRVRLRVRVCVLPAVVGGPQWQDQTTAADRAEQEQQLKAQAQAGVDAEIERLRVPTGLVQPCLDWAAHTLHNQLCIAWAFGARHHVCMYPEFLLHAHRRLLLLHRTHK